MTSLRSIRQFLFVALAALVLPTLAFVTSANAADSDESSKLADAMQSLAREVAQFVENEKETGGQIRIKNFDGPSSGGARIVKLLKESLGKMDDKVKMVDIGGYTVSGEFMGDKRDDQYVAIIEAKIKNNSGNTVHNLRKKIVTNIEEGLSLFGPSSVDLSESSSSKTTADSSKPDAKKPEEKPLTDSSAVASKVDASISKPNVFVQNNVAMLSDKSPYGIELLIKEESGYVACPVESSALAAGFAKVHVDPQKVFAIRVYNHSDRPVGLSLAIDGINVFAFSKNDYYRQLGKMVIYPGKSTILGWHFDGPISHEFLVTHYGDSAAARLGATEGLGMVTGTFFELLPPRRGKDDLGIGFGKETVMEYQNVPAYFGKPLGAVSIRYERPDHPVDLPPIN
ncbi:MAG: hypothetical protein KDA42_00105 [Planctomycetales bacterium]|nr:hypothetical protein [Planctomycetales bacterium]